MEIILIITLSFLLVGLHLVTFSRDKLVVTIRPEGWSCYRLVVGRVAIPSEAGILMLFLSGFSSLFTLII